MIFLMTKDFFLLQDLQQLKNNHEVMKINSLSEVRKVDNKPFKAIIDTYHNHILGERAIKFSEKLDAERVTALAPYHISKLKAEAPIYSVSRKESIRNLLETIYGKHLPRKSSQLCFSHSQFEVIRLILRNKNESNITSMLDILQQTLKTQKSNIMYKLKLRRMSDIVTLGIISYFQ